MHFLIIYSFFIHEFILKLACALYLLHVMYCLVFIITELYSSIDESITPFTGLWINLETNSQQLIWCIYYPVNKVHMLASE